jgi:hypothetical protein
MDKGLFADQVNEFPPAFIASIGVSQEFLSTELTMLLRSGQTVRLRNVL